MELKFQQLASHLQDTLRPIYLISGDEPLQVDEALQLIRAQARKQGCNDRYVYQVERGFDWNKLNEQTNNLSLFAEMKLLELRMPTGKPGKEGAKVLEAYCQAIPENTILLIQSGKLEKSTLSSRWVKATEQAGVLMRVWPKTGAELTSWVQARLRLNKLSDDLQTAEYIASCAEGNMFAAAQEIEKLALLQLSEANQDDVSAQPWMSNQSKYNVFDLVDTLLSSNRNKVITVLRQIRHDSVAPSLVLWALAELIRAVVHCAGVGSGGRIQNVFYYSKKQQLQNKARKYKVEQLYNLQSKCAKLDQMIKGRASGNVWDGFDDVALKLSR